MSTLTTGRTQLKPLTVDHAPLLWELIDGNREHLKPSFPYTVREVVSEATAAEWLQKRVSEWDAGQNYYRGIFDGATLMGMIALKRNYTGAPMGELSYYLGKQWTGKGIMTEALEAVIHWAYYQAHVHVLYLRTATNNTASNRVAEKLGFRLEKEVPLGLEFPDGSVDMYFYMRTISGPLPAH